MHKAAMVNAIAEPILGGLDSDYKPADAGRRKPKRRRRKRHRKPGDKGEDFSLAEARERVGDAAAEEALLRRLNRLGPSRVRNRTTTVVGPKG